jgi:hypothetical protein
MSRLGHERIVAVDDAERDAQRNAVDVRLVWAWLAERGIKRGRSLVAALDEWERSR